MEEILNRFLKHLQLFVFQPKGCFFRLKVKPGVPASYAKIASTREEKLVTHFYNKMSST